MSKPLRQLLADFEKSVIVATLARNNGSRKLTALALGITRRTLEKMLARHRLTKRVRWARRLPLPPEIAR